MTLVEEIAQLDSITTRSATENQRLELKRKVLEVTKSNERFFQAAVAAAFAIGVFTMLAGGLAWKKKVQELDDRLKELHVRKAEAELRLLENSLAESKNPPRQNGDA